MDNENKNEPTPEDEIFNQILFEIKRYENNQLEFFEAIDDFIMTSNEILDDE